MNLENLSLKEKLILIGTVRLFLWEIYGYQNEMENERKIGDIVLKEFPRPETVTPSDIDVVLDILFNLYEKLSYLILEEWTGE